MGYQGYNAVSNEDEYQNTKPDAYIWTQNKMCHLSKWGDDHLS